MHSALPASPSLAALLTPVGATLPATEAPVAAPSLDTDFAAMIAAATQNSAISGTKTDQATAPVLVAEAPTAELAATLPAETVPRPVLPEGGKILPVTLPVSPRVDLVGSETVDEGGEQEAEPSIHGEKAKQKASAEPFTVLPLTLPVAAPASLLPSVATPPALREAPVPAGESAPRPAPGHAQQTAAPPPVSPLQRSAQLVQPAAPAPVVPVTVQPGAAPVSDHPAPATQVRPVTPAPLPPADPLAALPAAVSAPVRDMVRAARKAAFDVPAAPPAALASPPAATPLPQAAAPSAPAPVAHDFAALVDRLAAAREAAQPQTVSLAVPHAEFGRVSLRFHHDGAALAVSMASADPDFARAASLALTPVPAATPTEAIPTPRADQPAGTPGNAGSDGSARPQAQSHGNDRRENHAARRGDPAPARAAQQHRPPRGGIFA